MPSHSAMRSPLSPVAYAIAIPARNEASRVLACLKACRAAMANSCASGVIVLLVNNSDDATASRAKAWAARTDAPLIVREVTFCDEQAHAGSARRAALDLARAQVGADGYLLTTDADTLPDTGWVAANLRALGEGKAALVCGALDLDPAEYARLPKALVEQAEIEDQYRRLSRELTHLLDPDPINLWPFHGLASGASLAMTAAGYDRIGGAPVVPYGEDRALARRFAEHDLPVLYSHEARVTTSCRLNGRAKGGMAHTIAQRVAGSAYMCDESVEPAEKVWFRASLKARMRHSFHNTPRRNILLSEIGVTAKLRRDMPVFISFGAFWSYLEAHAPALAFTRLNWDEMAAQLPRLIQLRDRALGMEAKPVAAIKGSYL